MSGYMDVKESAWLLSSDLCEWFLRYININNDREISLIVVWNWALMKIGICIAPWQQRSFSKKFKMKISTFITLYFKCFWFKYLHYVSNVLMWLTFSFWCIKNTLSVASISVIFFSFFYYSWLDYYSNSFHHSRFARACIYKHLCFALLSSSPIDDGYQLLVEITHI